MLALGLGGAEEEGGPGLVWLRVLWGLRFTRGVDSVRKRGSAMNATLLRKVSIY